MPRRRLHGQATRGQCVPPQSVPLSTRPAWSFRTIGPVESPGSFDFQPGIGSIEEKGRSVLLDENQCLRPIPGSQLGSNLEAPVDPFELKAPELKRLLERRIHYF